MLLSAHLQTRVQVGDRIKFVWNDWQKLWRIIKNVIHIFLQPSTSQPNNPIQYFLLIHYARYMIKDATAKYKCQLLAKWNTMKHAAMNLFVPSMKPLKGLWADLVISESWDLPLQEAREQPCISTYITQQEDKLICSAALANKVHCTGWWI